MSCNSTTLKHGENICWMGQPNITTKTEPNCFISGCICDVGFRNDYVYTVQYSCTLPTLFMPIMVSFVCFLCFVLSIRAFFRYRGTVSLARKAQKYVCLLCFLQVTSCASLILQEYHGPITTLLTIALQITAWCLLDYVLIISTVSPALLVKARGIKEVAFNFHMATRAFAVCYFILLLGLVAGCKIPFLSPLSPLIARSSQFNNIILLFSVVETLQILACFGAHYWSVWMIREAFRIRQYKEVVLEVDPEDSPEGKMLKEKNMTAARSSRNLAAAAAAAATSSRNLNNSNGTQSGGQQRPSGGSGGGGLKARKSATESNNNNATGTGRKSNSLIQPAKIKRPGSGEFREFIENQRRKGGLPPLLESRSRSSTRSLHREGSSASNSSKQAITLQDQRSSAVEFITRATRIALKCGTLGVVKIILIWYIVLSQFMNSYAPFQYVAWSISQLVYIALALVISDYCVPKEGLRDPNRRKPASPSNVRALSSSLTSSKTKGQVISQSTKAFIFAALHIGKGWLHTFCGFMFGITLFEQLDKNSANKGRSSDGVTLLIGSRLSMLGNNGKKQPTPADMQTYRGEQLATILSTPEQLEFFVDFTSKKHMDEGVRFLIAVANFRNEKNKKSRIAAAHAILFEFVLPNSPRQVGLSDATFRHLSTIQNDFYALGLTSCFDEPYDQIFRYVRDSPAVSGFMREFPEILRMSVMY